MTMMRVNMVQGLGPVLQLAEGWTVELDEKFCDVIVNRYIEQTGTDAEVFVERTGTRYKYSEVTADE